MLMKLGHRDITEANPDGIDRRLIRFAMILINIQLTATINGYKKNPTKCRLYSAVVCFCFFLF